MGAGAAGLGCSDDDDEAEDDEISTYGCWECHHDADGCPSCRTSQGDLEYMDSVDRIDAALSRARAAGVPGAEKYDGAWIRKSVLQAACPKTFADCIERDMAKRIEAARTGTKRSIREAAAQARARRKARRRRRNYV